MEQKSTLNYISKEKKNRIYHFLFDFIFKVFKKKKKNNFTPVTC